MLSLSPARLVLVTAFVVLLLNSGGRFSMGLMLKPMVDDLGWTRSTLSLAVTLFMLVSAAFLPVMGRLIDRFGAPWVLGIAVVLASVGAAAMGLITTPLEALILYGVVFAVGSAGTSIIPVGVMISRWYPHRLGMANSIAISGMGLGQLVIVTLLASQLASIGWRGSFVLLGVVTAALALPLIVASGRASSRPERGSYPEDGAADRGSPPMTFGLVLRSRRFWILLAVYAICGFQDFFIATHIVAFALDEGIEPLLAGNVLAWMGLFGLAGVLAAGWLSDRYGPTLPTRICFAIRIGVFSAATLSRDPSVIVALALLFGLTFWITAPLTIVFTRAVFGSTMLGTVSGLITMVHHSAGGLGAYVGAAIFDASRSYDDAFRLMLALTALAFVLTLMLKRVPPA